MDAIQGKRAVSYSRFSSSAQRVESIYEQQSKINKYINENGLLLVHEYADEAKSGKNDSRDDFKRMVNDAEKGMFDIIVILNFSRLFRNLYQHLTYKQKLTQCGVRIISIFENYDETTPEGTLFSNVQMSINQYYSDNLSRTTKNAALADAKNCKFMGGRTLYGYEVDPVSKRLRVNEGEAKYGNMGLFVLCPTNLINKFIGLRNNKKSDCWGSNFCVFNNITCRFCPKGIAI